MEEHKEELEKGQKIDTRLVCGFLDAGKTTYIQDCILNDYYHKYGTTLVLVFEQGEEEYDTAALLEKRTHVVFYDDGQDAAAFCLENIKRVQPGRIYVEMNAMMTDLTVRLPEIMNVTYVSTWIDWATLKLYYANFAPMLSQMVSISHQVTFRGCPSKGLLAPYGQAFRLMNHKAVYLRQDPMGYHEKAFDLFLPFSLESEKITVDEGSFLPLWLDAADHPEHYEGKILEFTDPMELRRINAGGPLLAGRIVMTCCMADLQFMSFELAEDESLPEGGWILLEARAQTAAGEYGRRYLRLEVLRHRACAPPRNLILSVRDQASAKETQK